MSLFNLSNDLGGSFYYLYSSIGENETQNINIPKVKLEAMRPRYDPCSAELQSLCNKAETICLIFTACQALIYTQELQLFILLGLHGIR